MRPGLFPRKKKNLQASQTPINPHSLNLEPLSSSLQAKNQELSLMMSYASLGEHEIRLQKDISAINSALAKHYRGMDYRNGYLFLGEVRVELARAIKNVIDRGLQVVTSGFKFKRIGYLSGVSEEISKNYPKDRSKSPKMEAEKTIELPIIRLQQISLQNQNDIQKMPKKWEYFSKGRTLQYYKARIYQRVGTELSHNQQRSMKKLRSLADESFLQDSYDRYRYQSSHRYGERSSHKSNNRRYVLSELQKRQRQSLSMQQQSIGFIPLNQEEIHEFLVKQFRVVSIWLPPMSGPQFMGFVSVVPREKKDGSFRCSIKKYYFLKPAINQRLFNCLLDQLSSKGPFIDELSLVCTKVQLTQTFQPIGWKIQHWIGPQRIRIQYNRRIL